MNEVTHERAFDLLCKLMNFPEGMRARIDGICRTSDGAYLVREKGDVGYNRFLGQPAPPHPGPGQDATLATWASMTDDEKHAVIALAAMPGDGTRIDLKREFGVPTEDVPMFQVVK